MLPSRCHLLCPSKHRLLNDSSLTALEMCRHEALCSTRLRIFAWTLPPGYSLCCWYLPFTSRSPGTCLSQPALVADHADSTLAAYRRAHANSVHLHFINFLQRHRAARHNKPGCQPSKGYFKMPCSISCCLKYC